MALHPGAFPSRLPFGRLLRLRDRRIRDECLVAREIRAQHPDVSRSEALRLAADLVARDYRAGRKPA